MPPRPNVLTAPATTDAADPPGYRGAEVLLDGARIGDAAGGRELVVRAFELAPGESLCPYHYEYVEEWLLLLSGSLDLRAPSGTERLETGALACFPPGADGAHKVTTPADAAAPARFVMFSDAREPAIAVYPDSDKIAAWAPGGADSVMLRRADGGVDYYEGELGD